jgi:putative ABC transport system permease protein
VLKAFGYQDASLLADGYMVSAFIAVDFGQQESNMLYLGRYPKHRNEAAISGLLSEATGKQVGDYITVRRGDVEQQMLITGITQLMQGGGINMLMTFDGFRTMQSDYQFDQVYVYLAVGIDAGRFLEGVTATEGGIYTDTVDIQELIDAQFGQFGQIFAAVALSILVVTALVITLVLYMVIRTMILRRRREFGIQKALGFSTGQLMAQVALGFTPMVMVGVALGALAGYFGFNPLFATLTHSAGIIQTDLPVPALWTAYTCLALSAYAYLVSLLVPWRIRHISPYALVNE